MKLLEGINCCLFDICKMILGICYMEKWVVCIGGGINYWFVLYDMIMLKDNYVDFVGGIGLVIYCMCEYFFVIGKDFKVEIEVRNFDELCEVL